MSEAPDYLETAAAILGKALTYWEQRAIRRADEDRAEILDARLRIAAGYAELAAVQRGHRCRGDVAEPGREATP